MTGHNQDKDNQLSEIFTAFNPELPDTEKFMCNLERNLDSVEFIRKNHLVYSRKNRLAAMFSGIAGFIAGTLMTLLFPFIKVFSLYLISSVPDISEDILVNVSQVVSWSIIAIVAVSVSLSSYEIITRSNSFRPSILR